MHFSYIVLLFITEKSDLTTAWPWGVWIRDYKNVGGGGGGGGERRKIFTLPIPLSLWQEIFRCGRQTTVHFSTTNSAPLMSASAGSW